MTAWIGAPQLGQNAEPSGTSIPHLGHWVIEVMSTLNIIIDK